MQEIITYVIGAVTLIIIARWLYRTLKDNSKGKCHDCTSCDSCESYKKRKD